MTAFDYVVLAILVASVVISTLRGLVKEVLSLVAWLAAFVIASRNVPAGTACGSSAARSAP